MMAHPYQKHREMHPGRSAVKRILKADGGMVEAKERLAKGLKERSDYLNDPDVGIQELDRREATADAFASGDYSKGTYKPFTPKRGR